MADPALLALARMDGVTATRSTSKGTEVFKAMQPDPQALGFVASAVLDALRAGDLEACGFDKPEIMLNELLVTGWNSASGHRGRRSAAAAVPAARDDQGHERAARRSASNGRSSDVQATTARDLRRSALGLTPGGSARRR
jgi:hypothetical protein